MFINFFLIVKSGVLGKVFLGKVVAGGGVEWKKKSCEKNKEIRERKKRQVKKSRKKV